MGLMAGGAAPARAGHTAAARPSQNTVQWVARRPSRVGQAFQPDKRQAAKPDLQPRATAQLRWKSSSASAPPRLLTKPSETERLATEAPPPSDDGERQAAVQPPLAASEDVSDSPIRLTGNTAAGGDPFQPVTEDADRDALPSGEIEDDSLPTTELNDPAVEDPSNEGVATEGDGTAMGDESDAPSDDADLSAELMDDDSVAEYADGNELNNGPRMVNPELDGDLPRFAQRTMDDAPSGEPFPAEIQDEEFPPREPEPGNESLDAGTQPERCPSPRDLKPINQITHRIAAEPGLFPQECVLSDEPFQPRNFSCTVVAWKASALCHKPLYFQQAKLERYGHTFGPVLTPVLSTGHFFVSVLALPYKIGMNPPWECMYPLGWYRPGSCAPYTLGPVPISLRGAALQGLVTTGLWFLFP